MANPVTPDGKDRGTVGMKRFVCPNCGNERFHEVGSVCTTTDVIIEDVNGKPTFIDYSDAGAESIWDASNGYFIECSQCLAHIDAEGFENTMPEDEALNKIHEAMDGVMWSSDTLDAIAEVVRAAGKEIRPPEEES